MTDLTTKPGRALAAAELQDAAATLDRIANGGDAATVRRLGGQARRLRSIARALVKPDRGAGTGSGSTTP